MTPTDRTEINQANAQHSTGPKTPEGKQRSSLNALRHGLTGQIVVMPTEDLEAYQLHVTRYTDRYHPKGADEEDLVQTLADATWRLNRVSVLEANLLALGAARAANVVADAPREVHDALAVAAAFESQQKAFATLSIHGQRLARQIEKTIVLLRELQATRKAEEKTQLNDLLDIMEMFENKGETYDPAEDGFVFSDQEIDAAQQARNRQILALEAVDHANA